jgi:hypothetical protein
MASECPFNDFINEYYISPQVFLPETPLLSDEQVPNMLLPDLGDLNQFPEYFHPSGSSMPHDAIFEQPTPAVFDDSNIWDEAKTLGSYVDPRLNDRGAVN